MKQHEERALGKEQAGYQVNKKEKVKPSPLGRYLKNTEHNLHQIRRFKAGI